MTRFCGLLFIITCLFACDSLSNKPEILDSEDDFKTISVQDKYSLKVPKYMVTDTKLNQNASLQYSNNRKQTYTMVIDADIEGFKSRYYGFGVYNDSASVLQNYSEVIIAGMKEAEPQLNLNSKQITHINGMEAHLYLFEGKSKGISISYILAFAQGEKMLYTLNCWTTSKKMEKYKNTFFQTIKSLKENATP